MCGIAGLFTVERPVDADLVSAVLRMADHQVHRGPSDWGILLPDEAVRNSAVRSLLEDRGWEHVRTYTGSRRAPAAVIINRRLSILDLSPAGRMPMGTADGRVWVTYNGEIYNFAEIRDELTARGHVFRSHGDTETLLHGYAEWGPEVVQHLRGMFAFAVLDVRRPDDPKLVLARDRFGIKPLYWGRRNCLFQFASEVRALMAGGLMPNEPEPRGFHGFLVYGSVPTPWTTVRDVQSLPAAHALEIDEVSYSYPKPRRYWAVPPAGSRNVSYDAAVSEVRRVLEESVRLHLVSDVPLGVFLSGGMDSTALVALASSHLDHPLTTLSVTFDESQFSEGEQAAATARRHGTKHVDVRIQGRDFLNDLPRILAAMDQPSVDGVNTYFVTKAAREAGLIVALSGLGGDEVFWGYPGFRSGPRLARLASLPGAARFAALIARGAGALGRPRLEKLEFLREHPLFGPYLAIRGLFPPSRAARLLGAGRLPLWVSEDRDTGLDATAYAQLELAEYLEHRLLRDTDVFGMSQTLEVRVPFLDHRLVELVAALPITYLCTGQGSKPLLAAALSDVYADGITTRPKMGFAFPFGSWMRQGWDELARQTAHPEPHAERETKRVTSDFRRGKAHWSRAWSLAVLSGMRRYGNLPPWSGQNGRGRLVFVLPQTYGLPGGIQRYSRALLKATAEVFPRAELAAVSVNDERIPADATMRGRVYFKGAGPRGRLLQRARVIAKAVSQTWRHRPQIILCGHINLMPLVWCLGAVFRAQTVLVGHGIEAWRPGGVRRWVARRSDRVMAVSHYTAARMREWGIRNSQISLLPNTVDADEFRPLLTKRERSHRYLLTVGRLERSEGYKGVDRVLAALPEILQHCPDVIYRVVGTGDDVPRLQALVADLGIASHVVFEGSTADERLLRLYSDADVFVMLSTGEGFGIVFLEALSCGVPAVAAHSAGSVDALLGGRLGKLIAIDDVSATAAAIVATLAVEDSDVVAGRAARRAAVLNTYGFDQFREGVREILGPGLVAQRLRPSER